MKLVPIKTADRIKFYEDIVAAGGEGTMEKDGRAPYVATTSRSKGMFKRKRHEEVDAFVFDFIPGEEGWTGLVGAFQFAVITEKGKQHHVASCSNMTLEDRKACTVCGKCGSELTIQDDTVDGKHFIATKCEHCHTDSPPPALRESWYNKVAEVRGQDFSARALRLTHAVIMRWREGADGKAPDQCTIDLGAVRRRVMENEMTMEA